MQAELEIQFKDLIEKGNKTHGTPWQAQKKGAITYSQMILLNKAIRDENITTSSVIHAATYAGKKSITIKLQ
jgi:hypothetical protein